MKNKRLITIFCLIVVMSACGNSANYNKFYANNRENFRKISALDLREYNFISHEDGRFLFDEDLGVRVQKIDSIKISKLLRELGLKTFEYRKNQYISIKPDQGLNGYYYIFNQNDKVDFGNYLGKIQGLIKRAKEKNTPFAIHLDGNWYWIEINENI